jgi:hypothetical protein
MTTTNTTWTDPGAKPGLRGETPATNRLSHGTANRPMRGWITEPQNLSYLELHVRNHVSGLTWRVNHMDYWVWPVTSFQYWRQCVEVHLHSPKPLFPSRSLTDIVVFSSWLKHGGDISVLWRHTFLPNAYVASQACLRTVHCSAGSDGGSDQRSDRVKRDVAVFFSRSVHFHTSL